MKHPIKGLPADVEWPEAVDPEDWRRMPDPDGDSEEDDEDTPTPQYVIDILGFDPAEFNEGF